MSLSTYLIVFAGAGAGGALRHGVNVGVARWFAGGLAGGGGAAFPFGTLAVNVGGCFAMGLLTAWFAFRGEVSQAWRLFLTTGLLGGFTTFSTFSLETALLWERGEMGLAALYAVGSVVGALAGFALGFALVRAIS